ncbi:putative dicer-like protein 2 [Diplodia seriata]|uniref:Putative dicer-like protein 2 n=1 Tax=Diplodia seriata TaxID=420778 RepID=A0A0G2G962_9PEZI|nr:putative dicer-like protein 2 [Diplodia seriata]
MEEYASAPPLYLERVEEIIGYTFKNKHLLLEALTHPSFSSYREAASSSYQRLEYLGDAVLDYILSRRLYAHRKPPPPPSTTTAANANGHTGIPPRGHAADEIPHGTMHSIRAALVNAPFLAFLCMEAAMLEPGPVDVVTLLGRLAGREKVVWEWVGDGDGDGDGVDGDGDVEGENESEDGEGVDQAAAGAVAEFEDDVVMGDA